MTDDASPTQAIVVDEVFPHAPETIWRTLTASELMSRWLPMVPTGFEPVTGATFTFQTTPAGEWDGTIRCEVLEVIPNERLVYSWKSGHAANVGYGAPLDTVVTFTLEKTAGGTRLRLVHSGFLPRNDMARRNMSGGWTQAVRRIGAITAEQTSSH